MKLREVRAQRFLTMRDLAAKAGVSLGTVRDIEMGKSTPSLRSAKRLAEALGVEPTQVEEFMRAVEKASTGRTTRTPSE